MWVMGSLTGLRSVENAVDGVGEYEQGFLTNTNRFVGRVEAMKIAIESGQVVQNETHKTNELFSEDLY